MKKVKTSVGNYEKDGQNHQQTHKSHQCKVHTT